MTTLQCHHHQTTPTQHWTTCSISTITPILTRGKLIMITLLRHQHQGQIPLLMVSSISTITQIHTRDNLAIPTLDHNSQLSQGWLFNNCSWTISQIHITRDKLSHRMLQWLKKKLMYWFNCSRSPDWRLELFEKEEEGRRRKKEKGSSWFI